MDTYYEQVGHIVPFDSLPFTSDRGGLLYFSQPSLWGFLACETEAPGFPQPTGPHSWYPALFLLLLWGILLCF